MLGLGLGLTAVRRPPAGTLIIGPDFLSPLASFTRASGATGIRDGVLTLFGNDQPRFVNDLTPTPALLDEGTARNLIRNPRGEGAVPGVLGAGGALPTYWSCTPPSGWTVTVLGTGVERGFPYVDVQLDCPTAEVPSRIWWEIWVA